MKAVELVQERLILAEDAFVDVSLWRLPRALAGSKHRFKYRLAYVVAGVAVLRYDNEAGKGDHRHEGNVETPYSFRTPSKLVTDFWKDIERWNHENRHS